MFTEQDKNGQNKILRLLKNAYLHSKGPGPAPAHQTDNRRPAELSYGVRINASNFKY